MKNNNTKHQVAYIEKGSYAMRAGIKVGDEILSINGHDIEDIFDYHFLSDDEVLNIEIMDEAGKTRSIHIEKEIGEDLGISFEDGLLDDYKSCHNKCIFCFIDQMPPGMRDTLYFKDDDTRLSFLQGNYVTLTNMKEKDLKRIVDYRLAPINISVQATNPKLRCKMLNNRFAGDILDKIKYFYDNEIPMNGQIVLCRGINDGEELERSIRELLDFAPFMESISVVPVGLSKFREGLFPLEPFDKESACATIDIIEKWQKIAMEKHDMHFVQASDEWYLLAERPLPEEERYDGYIQLENGVGMMRLLQTEVEEFLDYTRSKGPKKKKTVSIATGRLAGPFIRQLAAKVTEKYKNVTVNVYEIRNDFFGESITVSGLICGCDLIAQLKDKELGDELLIPVNMMRSQEEVFLDDVTLTEASEALQIPITVVESSGEDFVREIIKN